MNDRDIFLSIVIPAYNEEQRIEPTLREVFRYLDAKPYRGEIIIVNDGSTDRTLEVAQTIMRERPNGLILSREKNKGKGFSVREGMLKARGEIILFSDADLSTPIAELDKLLEAIREGYDIAIGSRGLPESVIRVHQPWLREHMGKTFNLLVRLLAIKGIKDTQCGFKCFKRAVAQDIFSRQTIKGFGFDVEILFLAAKSGYKVKEIPVQWFNSPNTRVKLIKDPLRMFWDLLKIRFFCWAGRYKLKEKAQQHGQKRSSVL